MQCHKKEITHLVIMVLVKTDFINIFCQKSTLIIPYNQNVNMIHFYQK